MRKCWPRSASRWMTSREWAARRLRRKRTARTGSDGQEDCLDRPGQGRRSRHRSANRDAHPARVGAVHTNRGGRRQTPTGHRTAGVSLARGHLPHSLLRSRRYHRDSRCQAPLRGLPLKKVEFEPTTLRLTAELVVAASCCKHKTRMHKVPIIAEFGGTLGVLRVPGAPGLLADFRTTLRRQGRSIRPDVRNAEWAALTTCKDRSALLSAPGLALAACRFSGYSFHTSAASGNSLSSARASRQVG